MHRSHQAKSESDVSQMESSRLCRTIHTKQKRKRFHLNGLQSHSSESDIAFVFAWCERAIMVLMKIDSHDTQTYFTKHGCYVKGFMDTKIRCINKNMCHYNGRLVILKLQ